MRNLLLLSALLAASPALLPAQEALLGDHPGAPAHIRQVPQLPPPSAARVSGVQTLAPFPFLDDFSYDSLAPSRTFWDVPSSLAGGRAHVPGLSVRKGRNAPSKGVCTFDGATFDGNLHEDALAIGYADYLISNPIDLSARSLADSIYLEFSIQRGGHSDAPEPSDSLVVYFDSTGRYDFARVWAINGRTSADSTFERIHIPLTNPVYLQDSFHFKIENYGSLNGEYDVWHIDYVRFAPGLSASSGLPQDASPTQVTRSPLHPWTAVPLDHFVASTWAQAAACEVVNAGGGSLSGSLSASLSDPIGGNPLSGTTTLTLGSFSATPGMGSIVAASSPFSEQAGAFASYGALDMTLRTQAGGDSRAANDTLRFRTGIDSVLAYDDGVSDAAYGLTAPRSFCQEFRIPAPDTLTAVWVYFTPYLYVSTLGLSTSLEGKNFRVSVWDTLAVDSFLVQTSQGMNIAYDSTLNSFNRYPLSNPVVVDTLFWLGLRQVDQMPLGVGFDRNFHDAPVYFEATNGDFALSSNAGALMIRPEFGRKRVAVAREPEAPQAMTSLQVFPNPVTGEAVQVRWGEALRKGGVVELRAMDGRLILREAIPAGSTGWSCARARMGASGVCLLRVSGLGADGVPVQASKRIVLE